MKVSCLIPYCNYMRDSGNLKRCLESLSRQTLPLHQIILADDSLPEDRSEIQAICQEYGVTYLEFPFVQFAPAFSRKFNGMFARVTGDLVMILCSNWILGPHWVAEMATWLTELGPKNIVASDNARQAMGDSNGRIFDWFAGYPDRFPAPGLHFIDEGFLTMLHVADWEHWDEDFDPPPGDLSETRGAWHAVIVWGAALMKKGVRLWLRRDLDATHQPRQGRESWLRQTQWSEGVMHGKGVQ